MKTALNWLKSNPVTVGSIVVVVLSLAFLVWARLQGGALSEEMGARKNTINQINALKSRSVRIPPEEPDGPERTFNITINPVAIRQISMLYDRMDEEYREIFAQAVQINRGGHEPLAPGLFPTTNDPALPHLARQAYMASFDAMFRPYPEDGGGELLPRLDAGMPPAAQQVADAVARVESDFRSAPSMAGQELTAEDQQLLLQEKRDKAIEILNEHARHIHIYAVNNPNDPLYPFQIMPWGREGDQPEWSELWEGQLELWIQEDLVRAIALANDVSDPNMNVINAPVKRLINIDVVPGYVGLHTAGGLYPATNIQRTDGTYPAPLSGRTGSADSRVSDNFYVGPTGRVSNALYDVRHARLQVVVDYARLTELFNSLAKVNFMTVLSVELEDVDEYEALHEGFIYGSEDVVQATLLIETVWLRDWTEALMPPLTRQYLGIDEPTGLGASNAMPYSQPGVMEGYGDPNGGGYGY